MVSKSKAVREILFRGKENPSGKWVEGFLVGHCHIGDWVSCTPIHSKTVGQFTGLTDKNGKKIFEGDIVHVLGNQQVEDWKNVNYIGSIAFLDAGFCVIDGTIEDHAFRRYQLPRLDFDLEVIGNIHDNPELLEGCDG